MRRDLKFRDLRGEQLEPRYCLSSVTFVEHLILENPELTNSALGGNVVRVADVDGDGDRDLVTISNNKKIGWHPNIDGKGTFGEEISIYEDQHDPVSLLPADLDDDGDQDVVVGAVNSELSMLENKGQGIFVDKTPFVGGGREVIAADVNGDDVIDVVTNGGWYENRGNNSGFEANREPWGSSLSVVDFDVDGDLDVVSKSSGRISWHENTDGRGAFGNGRTITELPFRFVNWSSIDVADLDGDGDLDVVNDRGVGDCPEGCPSSLWWYESRLIGDSNDDRIFNSFDLVKVFVAGKYEDGIPKNATFDEGDWNQDGDFDSGDLVFAFQAGNYAATATPLRNDIASAVDWLFVEPDDANKEVRNYS